MRTSLEKPIIQFQRRLEYGPADRQYFLILRVYTRIGIRRLNFLPRVPRADQCLPPGVLRFRLGASQQMR